MKEKKEQMNPAFCKVLSYIDRNYMRYLTLDDVSQAVWLSKPYICQLFAKNLGISFVTYLEQLRITKAQKLLRTTTMSSSEIARQLGYSKEGYFARVFRKHTGLTPLQYRCESFQL
jgi:YesN/AraC family two-component response regulator